MIRVEIDNFQSIAHQVVDLEGFSAVAGRSNIGKSAVVRAIKAAFTGAPADDYVRHGGSCPRMKGAKSCKCFCAVHITGPEMDLLWEKGDAVNRYLYNGREFTVVGRGTPEFLGEPLAPIDLGGERVLLQVFDQFAPLFLLDRSGTAVADALSDVAKLDEINTAVRLAEKDRKEASATRKVRRKDIADLGTALVAYEPLDGLQERVAEIEARYEATLGLESRRERLTRYHELVTRLNGVLGKLDVVANLDVPSFEPVRTGAGKLREVERYLVSARAKMASVSALAGLDHVTVPDIRPLAASAQAFGKLSLWVSKLVGMRSFFARVEKTEALSVPTLGCVAELSARSQQISRWAAVIKQCASQQEELQSRLATFDAMLVEIDAEFKGLGVCPTCAQPVRLPHLHGKEAAACLD